MPDNDNPYIPGQPVLDADLFFGRRGILSSIREHLVKGRRVFIISGPRQIGKTSLLRQIPMHLPEGQIPVYFDLSAEETPRLDRLLWRLAEAIGQQAGSQLGVGDLVPEWAEFEGHPEYLLGQFWPRMGQNLGERGLVLLLDGVDSLARREINLLEPLISSFTTWRKQDDRLALALATSFAWQETLIRQYPRLFGGAPSFALGALSSEEATRLITWPVDGVITYDYGVARRLVEITSGQPYYLQLLCFEVFERCAPAAWVNQRDIDLVVERLVEREIDEFRRVWDESSAREQAVLAALASLRGARGVATGQEVHTVLTKAGARVDRDQISGAMENLAARGILQRLGALSYRFRVALLKDWLCQRIDLEAVVRETRWTDGGKEKAASTQRVPMLPIGQEQRNAQRLASYGAGEPEAVEEGGEEERPKRGRPWLLVGASAVLVLVLLAVAAILLSPFQPVEPTPMATLRPTLTPRQVLATTTTTPVRQKATQPVAVLPSPTTTASPMPEETPTPTPPVVVARSLPAIAYQSRGPGEQRWSIYVMDSDGGNRTFLAEGQGTFLSRPAWSPDGSKIAYVSDRDGPANIWVIDIDGNESMRLTEHDSKDHSPAWSPDGEWIAFGSVRDAPYWELYTMRADGTDLQRLTWWEDASDLWPSWSPDGTRLAFASKRDGNWEIYVMDRDGENLVRLTNHPADDTSPAWSPDGSRIAFESTRDGYAEIYVMPIVGGEAVNVSRVDWATDRGPAWSPDGGRIVFYSDRDGEWDIYVMNSDGTDAVKLTDDNSNDQVAIWRP